MFEPMTYEEYMNRSLLSLGLLTALAAAGCATEDRSTTSPPATATSATASPTPAALTVVPRPARIAEMMRGRGEQDQARPVLKIIEPRAGATVNSSTVKVRLALSGDLKGYQPVMDPTTKMGNHVHVILDNQPYEAYYNLERPFELRNVSLGKHTLRVFPSRPWHESYKNPGAFQLVSFTVAEPKAAATPTAPPPPAAASPTPTPEGKDVTASEGGEVDARKPLLTYSRPKGENEGADAEAVMIDFWLANAKLLGDGGDHRVRYTIDGGEPKYIEKWEPIWIQGFSGGKHTVKLELVDKNGNAVENGGYNATTREITVVR